MREFERAVISRLDEIKALLESKKRSIKSKVLDVYNYEKFQNKWNTFCNNNSHLKLSKIQTLTEPRIRGIKNRIKYENFDFDLILKIIPLSRWLCGHKGDFKINFDFIFMSDRNWPSIIEGRYVDDYNRQKYHKIVSEHFSNLQSKPKRLTDILSELDRIGMDI